MMKAILFSLLGTVALPLALNEFTEWCPLLAERLARWSARRLGDAEASARYEEEYVGNLAEVPGKVSKLVAAFGYAANIPRMRWTLRAGRRAGPTEITERSAQGTPSGFIALY
ncbi:MAG: hypothetical protein ACRDSI_10885 [Pseudonocardiaceae bacterium]